MTARRVARVLLDSPLPQLDRLFDYAVPERLAADVVPGVRVRVPLRTAGRLVAGIAIDVVDKADGDDRPLSELDAVVSAVPVVPARLYDLVRRVADRAAGSANDILRLVVPRRMVRAEKSYLAAPSEAAVALDDAVSVAAHARLADFPGLADALASGARVAVDAPPRPVALPGDRTTTAWADLLAATAVATLAAGRSAILVVPDHRDLAALETALVERVPAAAILRDDSARSPADRYRDYLRMLEPVPRIVIGNRSSVYAPAHDTGLVAIWDDGDRLLGEPLAPGVHARDAALVRQELEGSALLIAGHTRTTDVARLIEVGWMREVPAARRESPRVILDAPRDDAARRERVTSAAFAAARAAIAEGPVLVQVSRPGFAPSLVCADCRRPARCPHCGGPLRTVAAGGAAHCAWCGRQAPGWSCPHCRGTRWRLASSGSERTADELGRAFPNARVIVSDGAHPVTDVDARPALVVATRGAEPLAAGGYRAVILLDGDRMLLGEGLRVAEDCLRWWSNAAALAAPGAPVHLVGVTGPVARALATWTQPSYARDELADRTALHMPPAVRAAAVEGAGGAVRKALAEIVEAVADLPADAVLGPVETTDDPSRTRALIRFDYARGPAVARALRAAVVAAAAGRSTPSRGGRPGRTAARNTLRTRVDLPDLDL